MASRRFRDLGYSLWLTFLCFIPYFGWGFVWIPWGISHATLGKRIKVSRRTVSKSSTP